MHVFFTEAGFCGWVKQIVIQGALPAKGSEAKPITYMVMKLDVQVFFIPSLKEIQSF